MTRLQFYPTAGLITVILATGCGGGSETSPSAPAARAYFGTETPGDAWSYHISTSDFTAENKTKSLHYSGSVTNLPSGFVKLTLPDATYTNDSSMAPFPAAFYAYEIPLTVLIAKRAQSESNALFAVALGNCPTAAAKYNWIKNPKVGWDADIDAAYGTADMTLAGATLNFSVKQYKLDGTALGGAFAITASCDANGDLVFDNGDVGTVSVNGSIVIDKGVDGGLIGTPTPSSTLDVADLVSRNYRGVHFEKGFKTGPGDTQIAFSTTEAIWAEAGAGAYAGQMIGGCFADVEANTRCDTTVKPVARLDFVHATQASPGMIRVNVGTQSFVMMANRVNGSYVLTAIGKSLDPVNGHVQPSLFLVAQY